MLELEFKEQEFSGSVYLKPMSGRSFSLQVLKDNFKNCFFEFEDLERKNFIKNIISNKKLNIGVFDSEEDEKTKNCYLITKGNERIFLCIIEGVDNIKSDLFFETYWLQVAKSLDKKGISEALNKWLFRNFGKKNKITIRFGG